ncbi:hypothetical protein HMPREF9089_00921 [Eubacterium brachy ATCC 33089]|nr:hypothetical protein HMPREF9089_00921 [Eubacterium brachy ATCC 33089]
MNNKYIQYDYESTFNSKLDADDKRIEKLLSDGRIKGIYATKTIKAGKSFEVEIYPEFTKKSQQGFKLKKINKTAQKNLNDKNARKRLERLINTNFKNGDYWVTLTYTNENLPTSLEAAQKDMKNYIERINYRRKKKGLNNAKYIYVTEFSEKGRCHHHLIMDCDLDMKIIESVWKKGRRNNVRRIAEDEQGITGLAYYLTKDPQGRKRWKSSQGLKRPIERKSYSVISKRKIQNMIKNQDSIEFELEKIYKGKKFMSAEVKYNKYNCKFYIYARMINAKNRE